MKLRSILSIGSIAVTLMVVFAIGCNKKFDDPAMITSTGLTANKSIKDLKTQYNPLSGEIKLITDDIIIRGIVVGNDRTGNIYKSIYIQDYTGDINTSAGIQVDIDATGLYNYLPVGREVFILCKGLYISNINGMIHLGTRVVENGTPVAAGIRNIYVDSYIKRGALNKKVDTIAISNINTLNNDYQSMLIRLNDFQVNSSDLNKTWADTSVNKSSTNINLQNCGGQTIIIRTSGYANFAGVKVPQGKGTVTAIYTVFNTTKQLIIRDTTDVKMTDPRCGSGVPAGLNYMTIAQIRALGAGATIPANTGIRGTVVSNSANEAALNYRIQDGSGSGIQIRIPLFNPAPPYALNDSIAVEVSNLTVDLFNGDMQITNIANTAKLGSGIVTPRVATIAQINANANTWASTVVKINNVTITAGTTNATGKNYTITDATGSIVTFVRNTLGYTPPIGAVTSITGYVSLFNGTPQLTLRVPADVQP